MSEKTAESTAERTAPLGRAWVLAIIPLLLLGVMLAYLAMTGGGLSELAGPPIEQVAIQRITLPEPGVIEVQVVNDGPGLVIIPQVLVDDAYWAFSAEPSNEIPRFGSSIFTIPYPWVEEETHIVRMITSLGATFDAEIAAAVKSPQPTVKLLWQFALLGLYVGFVPVLLGMLWYPFLRRLGREGMNFILSLTVGLLVYLAIGTWLDAVEFANDLPAFWQGVPMVALIALLTLGLLTAVGSGGNRGQGNPLTISYFIALGIGLHNLGEGLAIGAAFTLGQAALGTFLVLGFTLHNITEGVGIVAPIAKVRPAFHHFLLLAMLAGLPAMFGTWIGGFAFSTVLATVFLAIGVGAILQVIWEVGKLIARDSAAAGRSILSWGNLAGFGLGVAIMYFTAFMVKF